MKKNKRKLKGMTLVEMIISLAIFAIMGAVLVMVGMHVDNTTRATTTLKGNIALESPYAANREKTYNDVAGVPATLPKTDEDVIVDCAGISGDYIQYVTNASGQYVTEAGGHLKSTQIHYNNPTCTMVADKYQTKDIADNLLPSRDHGDLNFQFLEIQEVTVPASAGPTAATT